jgi:hypothetical protein
MAYRAGRSGYSPEPSFRAIWENDDQDGFVGGQEFLADEVYDRHSDTYLYYGFPTEDSAPVEITAADFQYVGPIKRKGRSAYVEKPVKNNGSRAKLPRNHYFVYTRGGALVAGPISKDGAVTRTHHDSGLVYYVAQNTVQFEELKRGMIPSGLYASSAKPNGFKHARPFGGSIGREQYHVHFEDAKGVIYYYAGNTDKGVKLEREYGKAKKFNASRAAQLAKRLDRLYKNVRHDGGHFYAESAGDVKVNGASKARLAAEYKRLIGYDPFEDKPGITVREVQRVLREYKKAARVKSNGDDFGTYTKRDCLDYIARNDPNGFATLEGDESLAELREACRMIAGDDVKGNGDPRRSGKTPRGEEYFEEGTGRRLVISTRKREDVESDNDIRIDSDTVSASVWRLLKQGGGRADS